jgi:hypothetical protein
MSDPTQLLNCTSQELCYRNDYYPIHDGIFSINISWVETSVGKGQRPQWRKLNTKGQWTEPPREPWSTLVFMTKRLNGLVDWHIYNLSKMTDNEIYAMEQRFAMDDYQRSILDAHFNGEALIKFPGLPEPIKSKRVDSTIDSKSAQTGDSYWEKLSAELVVYANTGKVFTKAQRDQLREMAFVSAHNLPGKIHPWNLNLTPDKALTELATLRKIHFLDLHQEILNNIEDPKEREEKRRFFKRREIDYFDFEEKDKKMNAEWYEAEAKRRNIGLKVQEPKSVKKDFANDLLTPLSKDEIDRGL